MRPDTSFCHLDDSVGGLVIRSNRVGACRGLGPMSEHQRLLAQLQTVWDTGTPEEAAPLAMRLKVISARQFGRDSAEFEGALLWHGQVQEELGEMGEANVAYCAACNVRADLEGAGDLGRAACLSGYTQKWVDWGRYEIAEALHREALSLVKSALGPDHPRTAEYAVRLDQFLKETGVVDDEIRTV